VVAARCLLRTNSMLLVENLEMSSIELSSTSSDAALLPMICRYSRWLSLK